MIAERPQRHRRVRGPRERPLRGPRHRPRRSAATCSRRRLPDGAERDRVVDRQPPERRARLLRARRSSPGSARTTARPTTQCNAAADLRATSTSPRSTAGCSPTTRTTRPSDVATTTTDQGKTVPFIIRIETGYQDRDQYKIAVLYDPAKAWKPWAPQQQWNHKLLITHGASCGIDHQSGTAPSVTGDTRRRAVQPRARRRARPRLRGDVDRARQRRPQLQHRHPGRVAGDGEGAPGRAATATIRYTIGTGCSGGSLAQQQVANAYPGIYQGILPQCSFPDAWSTGQQLAAYHLIRGYFENPTQVGAGRGLDARSDRRGRGPPQPRQLDRLRHGLLDGPRRPDDGCAGVADRGQLRRRDQPGRRPLHPRRLHDQRPRPAAARASGAAPRRQVGHGFAGLPLGDVGVQFGLEALREGADHAGPVRRPEREDRRRRHRHQPDRRSASTPTSRRCANAYRSGGINETNNLDRVAIIDLRGPDPGAFHDAYRSWAIRARLEREQGHFPRNHVIWFGQAPLIGDPQLHDRGPAGDGPLARRGRGRRPRASRWRSKVAEDRPADVHDRCSQIDGRRAGLGARRRARSASWRRSRRASARRATVAGEGIATDTNNAASCKPLRRTDYYPIELHRRRSGRSSQTAFPTGVCDWRAPGVDQQDTIPWLTYQEPGRRRGLRRPPPRRGARGLGRRLDERRLRLLALRLESRPRDYSPVRRK